MTFSSRGPTSFPRPISPSRLLSSLTASARTVELVDYAGDRKVYGFQGLTQGAL